MLTQRRGTITTPVYKIGVYVFLGMFLLLLTYLFVQFGPIAGAPFAIIPVIIFVAYTFTTNPHKTMMLMFISSYFIMGLTRYVPIPSIGMMIDGLLFFTIITLLIRGFKKKISWANGRNEFMFASLIWFIYCIMELFNTHAVTSVWITFIRFMALYAFLISFLVPIVFNQFKDLKTIVFLWSIFSFLAFFKALYQKEVGFDAAEMRWLWVEGKASTHILSSGIRYFSFFTDAANFGSGMGMSMVVFVLIGINSKQLRWKLYYIIVGLCTGYAMMLSGTRSAMIIPFVGFAFYILFSRKMKIIAIGGILILLAFIFFNFTMIGQGNSQIRRMRSAFNSEHDASYNLRKSNQAKLAMYLVNKPFGVGIGLGGGKSGKKEEYATTIATDSWGVVLWVETGVVGLALYIILFLYLQFKGAYVVFFKIKDEQLKSILGALLAGIFGIMISSYSNEVIAQFPNGIIIFFAQAFIFMGLKYDKQIAEQKLISEQT